MLYKEHFNYYVGRAFCTSGTKYSATFSSSLHIFEILRLERRIKGHLAAWVNRENSMLGNKTSPRTNIQNVGL